MATQAGTIRFPQDKAADAQALSARTMFGEETPCCDSKGIAPVCNDRLPLKPAAGAPTLVPDPQKRHRRKSAG